MVPAAAAQHGHRRLVQSAARAQVRRSAPAPASDAGHRLRHQGRWKYLEHDWIAEEGSFVYEPPGEIHTLTVPADCPEMITFFNISGAMIYLDAEGGTIGYEDVFTKLEMCRRHYAAVGLGADYVDAFVR